MVRPRVRDRIKVRARMWVVASALSTFHII